MNLLIYILSFLCGFLIGYLAMMWYLKSKADKQLNLLDMPDFFNFDTFFIKKGDEENEQIK